MIILRSSFSFHASLSLLTYGMNPVIFFLLYSIGNYFYPLKFFIFLFEQKNIRYLSGSNFLCCTHLSCLTNNSFMGHIYSSNSNNFLQAKICFWASQPKSLCDISTYWSHQYFKISQRFGILKLIIFGFTTVPQQILFFLHTSILENITWSS